LPFVLTSFTVLDDLDAAFWEEMLSGVVLWEETPDRQPELRENELPTGELIIEFR
jgi:hypothetical protein